MKLTPVLGESIVRTPAAHPESVDFAKLKTKVRRRVRQVLIVTLLGATLLFGAAGRLNWVEGWVFMGRYLLMLAGNARMMLVKTPELAAERGEVHADAKTWDRWLALIAGLLGPLIVNVTAGLDERFEWTEVPAGIKVLGAVLTAGGYILVGWAMASNRFFSGQVRIQTERGHQVEHTGPYQLIRHPGYTGMSLTMLGIPLLLGSLWALLAGLVTVVVVVVRTRLEDATLQVELPGYREYSQKVRWRLVPGIW